MLNSVSTGTDLQKREVLRKITWLMPDGIFRDNNPLLVKRDTNFLNEIVERLHIEFKDIFTDTDNDNDVDAYDAITAPERVPDNEIWYTVADGHTRLYTFNMDGNIIDCTFKELLEYFEGVVTYLGPKIIDEKFDKDINMWRMIFAAPVTDLGIQSLDPIEIYVFFASTEDFQFPFVCNAESINLPNIVTNIRDMAFYSCTGLTSVTIGNSVTSIGEGAFDGCSSLYSIICKATTPPSLGGNTFENTNDYPIYVPTDSVDAYKTSWSEYASRIVCLLNNNQIRYTANEQLTIKDSVDYTEHTFDNWVGIVTFNNDLTTLDYEWFRGTFDNYIDNITSLTLPNGISSIEMRALSGTNTVYYEGTQKECVRIDKDWLDGTGVEEYHCFDGIANDLYNSNMVNTLILVRAYWLRDLIGEENFNYLVTKISSIKIDEQPMTAGDFITMFVNGTQDVPGLSAYGFTVENQEIQGVTVPLAYHAESGHYIGITKATDYAYVDFEHIAKVAVNESLDPDYMYILLDDTAISPEPVLVDVTIEYEDGTSANISLDQNQTYADQGYWGYYSQNTYDSIDETADTYLVDDSHPYNGAYIYNYCNDIRVSITVYNVNGGFDGTHLLRTDKTFSQQGYTEYYTTNEYDSDADETPEMYLADNRYPGEEIGEYLYLTEIYNDIRDVASDPEPEPEPDEP